MSFAASVGRFSNRALIDAEKLRRQIILKLFSAVIKSTPVDKGTLRGNWQTSTDTPKTERLERTSAEEAIAEIGFNIGDGTTKDVTVFFVNNLPYAARVEFEGWSHTKAPQGMLMINVQRFTEKLRTAKNKRALMAKLNQA